MPPPDASDLPEVDPPVGIALRRRGSLLALALASLTFLIFRTFRTFLTFLTFRTFPVAAPTG